jgi:hypothetical protein
MPNFGASIAGYQQASPAAPATQLPYVAPPSAPSAPTPNKILMFRSDGRNGQTGVAYSNVGGLVMTDGDFGNPTTIQLDSPAAVAGGDGKVVTISWLGQIKVYDESTGQLEQTFNDSYLDYAKANGPSAPWDSANDAVIGAGKIFINAHEYTPKGVGSIIVIDLLDRNVDTYLITPTLSNYSRLGSAAYGGIRFIDGRIYASTSPWVLSEQGIHHFAVDGSDHQFIPMPGAESTNSWVKWGDNFVVRTGQTEISVFDVSGTIVNTLAPASGATRGISWTFGHDLAVTSTGKLVVLNMIDYDPSQIHSILLYDEGFTNEIAVNGVDQLNGVASMWGYGTTDNGSLEVFGEHILVSAEQANNNGITNCGAVYRYNDSGVLQDIFYGTVADQKIGTNVVVGW